MTPVVDRPSARDELYRFARDSYATALVGVGVQGQMRYAGVVYKATPDEAAYFARTAVRVVSEDQETLRCEVRRFCTVGLAFLQLFAPVVDDRAQANTDVIAESIRDAYRAYRSDNLEFTNPWINDNVPQQDQAWLQVNVVANFAYRQFV